MRKGRRCGSTWRTRRTWRRSRYWPPSSCNTDTAPFWQAERSRAPLDSPSIRVDLRQPNGEIPCAVEQNHLRHDGEPGWVEAVTLNLPQKRLLPTTRNVALPLSLFGALSEAAQLPTILAAGSFEEIHLHQVMRHTAVVRILRECEPAGHLVLEVLQLAEIAEPDGKVEADAIIHGFHARPQRFRLLGSSISSGRDTSPIAATFSTS